MDVHQVLVAAGTGDAITNEALRLREELRTRGGSEIYAYHRDPRLDGVLPLDAMGPPSGDSLLVAHSSIGEKAVFDFLSGRPEPLVVRYHNITPAEFFEPYDPGFARLLRLGREELVELRSRVRKAVAVSEFNKKELLTAGYARTAVVPLVTDTAALAATPVVQEPIWLPSRGEGPLVLFVGRIAPNKAQHRLIQAFHVLKTYLRQDAQMCLVGGRGVAGYSNALERYVRELALRDLTLTGAISQAELAAVYRRADVFLSLSEHEGFCAPLLEAMAFDVPIVALDRGAVAETLGRAGVLLDDGGAAVAAEAVHQVLENSELASHLVEAGRRRVLQFRPEVTVRALADEILAA
jgi:glycosyltransferase involved in cell wall biosynthesis